MGTIPKPTKSKKTDDIHPRLDEFTQEEIVEKLQESFESKKPVLLFVWKHDPIKGTVVELNGQTQRIHIRQEYNDTIKVPFKDILKVDDPGE